MAAAAALFTSGSFFLNQITRKSRSEIVIDISNTNSKCLPCFTTADQIEGTVTITPDHDISFDEVRISFQGSSKASVESESPIRTVRSTQHTFLSLHQPIEETAYPKARVFKSGHVYRFPFIFVIPEYLLPQACSHTKDSLHVENAHLSLPSTIGDSIVGADGKRLDDMCPDTCQIAYYIRASIMGRSLAHNASTTVLSSVTTKIRIMPAVDEEPPWEDPWIRKEQDVRKGLMRGKLGRLQVAASQSKPLQLSLESDTNMSTMATVHLRFDPVENEQPPRLDTLQIKLKASTYFAVVPWNGFPTDHNTLITGSLGRGVYTETVPISSPCISSVKWAKYSSATSICRETLPTSTGSITTPYYTASIVVPITIPKGKAFLPTFHSCLISRVYFLDFNISYQTPNANILTPSTSLRVPIQIACQRQMDKAY
ncbi:hypothetical protein ASPWEDRAFT_120444 [Aspergillus wentii DTO 134E9]|uniref:Arrestin-like N-terminal domain-containing protein n=1 Tax=Aspergillus wentii DTO 134E9 TaxID=1073089 RepID=A0A1L9R5A6_ASPWE|nr:uncharacterized protein ASPWEDRAFT_120444 [Aspergillus wentii DTO 134E9]OJJ30099.1 hypothetical protein ASPWEDRAFT_120444 [Aspergillus wentii DTO 134E9]